MCKRSPSTVTLRTLYCAGLSNTSTAYLRKLEWNKLNMVLACFSSLEPDFVHRFASALICSRRREFVKEKGEGERKSRGGGGGGKYVPPYVGCLYRMICALPMGAGHPGIACATVKEC
jgi:hypothetical protein